MPEPCGSDCTTAVIIDYSILKWHGRHGVHCVNSHIYGRIKNLLCVVNPLPSIRLYERVVSWYFYEISLFSFYCVGGRRVELVIYGTLTSFQLYVGCSLIAVVLDVSFVVCGAILPAITKKHMYSRFKRN